MFLIIKSMYLVQTKISSESDFNFSILLRILVQCSLLKFPSFRALRQPRERVLKQVFLMVLWLGLLHTGVALQKKLYLHYYVTMVNSKHNAKSIIVCCFVLSDCWLGFMTNLLSQFYFTAGHLTFTSHNSRP